MKKSKSKSSGSTKKATAKKAATPVNGSGRRTVAKMAEMKITSIGELDKVNPNSFRARLLTAIRSSGTVSEALGKTVRRKNNANHTIRLSDVMFAVEFGSIKLSEGA